MSNNVKLQFLCIFQAKTHSSMIYTRGTANGCGRACLFPASGSVSFPALYRSFFVRLDHRYSNYSFISLLNLSSKSKLISLTASFELQNISDIVQLAFMCFVLVGILVALQFPAVLYTPWAALAFSIAATGTVGTISTVVGGPVAPLPLFALILVN